MLLRQPLAGSAQAHARFMGSGLVVPEGRRVHRPAAIVDAVERYREAFRREVRLREDFAGAYRDLVGTVPANTLAFAATVSAAAKEVAAMATVAAAERLMLLAVERL